MIHLTRVLEQDPSQAELHFELANLLVEQNDLAMAVRHYSAAVKLRPGYVGALQNLGAALLRMGDVDRATPYLERTLQLDPTNEQARSNLAQVQELRSCAVTAMRRFVNSAGATSGNQNHSDE